MKNIIVAVLALTCSSAFADSICGPGKTADFSVPDPPVTYPICMATPEARDVVGHMRDAGAPPQAAFDEIERRFGKELNVKTVCHTVVTQFAKNLVNATYFNPRFSGQNAYAMAQTGRQECALKYLNAPLRPLPAHPQYQPLK